jgi:8-oxo-dGTP pyrophosphatase MutT (NUDIX family)
VGLRTGLSTGIRIRYEIKLISGADMMLMNSQVAQIIKLDRVEISVEPWHWEFAIVQRDEISRYFAHKKGKQPELWNGQILLMHRHTISNRVLRGHCFTTEFANYLAWRDWNYPDPSIRDFFAAAGLRAADGAYLIGEMGLHTSHAGMCYFPCGAPEPADLDINGAVDLVANLRRELQEETGIELKELQAEPGWTLVHDRAIFAMIKRLTARESANQLRSRILRHLASERMPELSDIHIVDGLADVDHRIPPFVVAYLQDAWRDRNYPSPRQARHPL